MSTDCHSHGMRNKTILWLHRQLNFVDKFMDFDRSREEQTRGSDCRMMNGELLFVGGLNSAQKREVGIAKRRRVKRLARESWLQLDGRKAKWVLFMAQSQMIGIVMRGTHCLWGWPYPERGKLPGQHVLRFLIVAAACSFNWALKWVKWLEIELVSRVFWRPEFMQIISWNCRWAVWKWSGEWFSQWTRVWFQYSISLLLQFEWRR